MNYEPDLIASLENIFYLDFTANVDSESGNLYVLCSTPEKAAEILNPQTTKDAERKQRLARKALSLGCETIEVFTRELFRGDIATVCKGKFSSRLHS